MDIYHRRLKLRLFFTGQDRSNPPLFTAPSDWTPPDDLLPPEMKVLIKEDKAALKTFKKPYLQHNLSTEEQKCLKRLIHNKNIVIKKADKGSAIVIQDRDKYILEAMKQLNDREYYHELDKPIYLETIPLIDELVNELFIDGFINVKQKMYLKGTSDPRLRRFYTLPKIHKDPEKWTVPYIIPKGRPIVSDCNSETCRTAEFIEHHLHPLSIRHPSYLKDTSHFIKIINNLKIPINSYLFTIDINSLYTNISTEAGLKAVKHMFKKYPDKARPEKVLLQLLEINLTRNDFEFNNEYFLQIKGTAMGKRFAPSYANIFMAEWERKALLKCKKKPFIYLRYLDDIFGIWTYNKRDFWKFIKTLDSFDPSIRLDTNIDKKQINYLDTTIYKDDNFTHTQKLQSKVYFKTTDTHALLHRDSFHPRHTFEGLVKSQLIRFKRISSKTSDFNHSTKILFSALRSRGYTRSLLRRCFKTFQDRKTKTTKQQFLPLVTDFTKTHTMIHRRFKNNFQKFIIEQGLLKNTKVISAYRRQRNLGDLLTRARLPDLTPTDHRTQTED